MSAEYLSLAWKKRTNTVEEKLVLLCVSDSYSEETSVPFRTKWICQMTLLNSEQVTKALQGLVGCGFIQIVQNPIGGDSRIEVNRYQFNQMDRIPD